MQNHLLTDTVSEQTYTLPFTTEGELATETTQTTQNTQVVHDWLKKIQRKAHRDKRLYWGLFAFFQAFLFVPIALSNTFPAMSNGHFNLTWLALMFLSPVGMAALALRFTFKKPDWNAEEMTHVGGVQDVEATKTLLRASALENAAPKTLLRPVGFTPDANPELLLHAADMSSPLPPAS